MKKVSMDKRSSLFCPTVSDEEKKFLQTLQQTAPQQLHQAHRPQQPVQPQPHIISSRLSRQLKLRGRVRRSSSISSLHESSKQNSGGGGGGFNNNNNNNNGGHEDADGLKKVVTRPSTTTSRTLVPKSRVDLSKPEKVPEPCRWK
jgi:hypothetical protein